MTTTKPTVSESNVIPIFSRQVIRNFSDVPLFKQAQFFLDCVAQSQGIKLTKIGNLNRTFVQTFWKRFVCQEWNFDFIPYSQEKCPEITKLCFLLEEAGFIKEFKNQVILTELGKELLKSGEPADYFLELFSVCQKDFNWASEDLYPEFEFIQDNNLYLLEKLLTNSANNKFTAIDLYKMLFSSNLTNEDLSDDEDFYSPHAEVIRCLKLRFIERFCIPFGLVEPLPSESIPIVPMNYEYTKTPFFLNKFPEEIQIFSVEN